MGTIYLGAIASLLAGLATAFSLIIPGKEAAVNLGYSTSVAALIVS